MKLLLSAIDVFFINMSTGWAYRLAANSFVKASLDRKSILNGQTQRWPAIWWLLGEAKRPKSFGHLANPSSRFTCWPTTGYSSKQSQIANFQQKVVIAVAGVGQ